MEIAWTGQVGQPQLGLEAEIKLLGSATSLPASRDEGAKEEPIGPSITATQQKMERWERPLGCKGPGNSNDIFWRLSDCPIREADI